MAQATFSVRMEEGLKRQFDELCCEFGMNATTAFNIFARAVVRERRIPFEIASPPVSRVEARNTFYSMRKTAEANGLQDMSLDEINEEIRKARVESEGQGQ